MAIRYTEEELLHLRQSPLCIRPNTLPPAEEWMGQSAEPSRNNNQNARADGNRNRHDEGALLDQNNRRPAADRHASRNSANPDEILLGPPRTAFSSTSLSRNPVADKTLPKDSDGRFPFRARPGETDTAERNRAGRVPRERDGRTDLRRRGDADQDSDGWSTVKPRKSFGAEGAERFHGRMGDRPERAAGDRRPREQEGEIGDRSRRNFGEFGKDKEPDDGTRRNALGRTRVEQTWSRGETGGQTDSPPAPARERFDRAKSWRDRNAEEQQSDVFAEKPRDRGHERRWDRQEREPEWLDEPAEDKAQAHTQEDFQKFMDSMKAAKNAQNTEAGSPAPQSDLLSRGRPQDNGPATREIMTPIESGPDKFFAAYGQGSSLEPSPGAPTPDAQKENVVPSKQKASRFQNFFSNQEETRRHVEATPPPPPRQAPPPGFNPLLELLSAGPSAVARPPHPDLGSPPQNEVAEKVAFQALLTKLQKQSFSSPPNGGGYPEPPPSHELGLPKGTLGSPGSFLPYGQERRDMPMHRGPPQNPDLHAPRPQQQMHMAAGRPEQMLHELLGQRQNTHSQGLPRNELPLNRNSNSNTEFLMTLMQGSSRGGMEPLRHDQPPMRMPQPSRAAQMPQTPDRESDYQRERSTSQHHGGRPGGLPAFFDESHLQQHRDQDSRGLPQQPTQILQRQGPPGLDQMHPSSWMQQGGAGQQMPPGRPMIPPPGLGASSRNGPPVPGMFPPNFPMGNFPPPEGMPPGPPRNMVPPPGFFGGPPPPGFMGPPPGMGGFQGGPEGLGFGFDGRGMPPPPAANGPYRRN
ncbi:neural Wiskott-Aldrich syndrome protein [Microdochium nivale]|nr:neural Wiskott-Aldrich syndrome protein [Microdochium nivale]